MLETRLAYLGDLAELGEIGRSRGCDVRDDAAHVREEATQALSGTPTTHMSHPSCHHWVRNCWRRWYAVPNVPHSLHVLTPRSFAVLALAIGEIQGAST